MIVTDGSALRMSSPPAISTTSATVVGSTIIPFASVTGSVWTVVVVVVVVTVVVVVVAAFFLAFFGDASAFFFACRSTREFSESMLFAVARTLLLSFRTIYLSLYFTAAVTVLSSTKTFTLLGKLRFTMISPVYGSFVLMRSAAFSRSRRNRLSPSSMPLASRICAALYCDFDASTSTAVTLKKTVSDRMTAMTTPTATRRMIESALLRVFCRSSS